MIKFFLASIAIHIIAFVLIFSDSKKEKETKQDEEPSYFPVEIKIKPKGNGLTRCENTYSGIGIMYSPRTNIIMDAPEGLPAHNAGVRDGDYLFNAGAERPRTGPMTMKVRRNGKILYFKVEQDEICIDE